jgi:hypothetical protein
MFTEYVLLQLNVMQHDSSSVTRSSSDALESTKLHTGLHPDITILRLVQKVLWIFGVALPNVSSFLPIDHSPPVPFGMTASPKHLWPLKIITTNIPVNGIAIVHDLKRNNGMYSGEGNHNLMNMWRELIHWIYLHGLSIYYISVASQSFIMLKYV